MPDTHTVNVPIPVEAGVAAALGDARARAAIGRLVSRVLRPHAGAGEFAEAIAEAQAEARAAGLTDASADAERAAAGKALAAEFRAFRRSRALGGLDPKALIREGLR